MSSHVPADGWEKVTVRKCEGVPCDTMYRHGNWGIGEEPGGRYKVYVVVNRTPMPIMDGLGSFDDCVGFINGAMDGRDTRDLIVDEHEAVNEYEDLADRTADPRAKRMYRDIAREEKVHAGELNALLDEQDPENPAAECEGRAEAQEMLAPPEGPLMEPFGAKVMRRQGFSDDIVQKRYDPGSNLAQRRWEERIDRQNRKEYRSRHGANDPRAPLTREMKQSVRSNIKTDSPGKPPTDRDLRNAREQRKKGDRIVFKNPDDRPAQENFDLRGKKWEKQMRREGKWKDAPTPAPPPPTTDDAAKDAESTLDATTSKSNAIKKAINLTTPPVLQYKLGDKIDWSEIHRWVQPSKWGIIRYTGPVVKFNGGDIKLLKEEAEKCINRLPDSYFEVYKNPEGAREALIKEAKRNVQNPYYGLIYSRKSYRKVLESVVRGAIERSYKGKIGKNGIDERYISELASAVMKSIDTQLEAKKAYDIYHRKMSKLRSSLRRELGAQYLADYLGSLTVNDLKKMDVRDGEIETMYPLMELCGMERREGETPKQYLFRFFHDIKFGTENPGGKGRDMTVHDNFVYFMSRPPNGYESQEYLTRIGDVLGAYPEKDPEWRKDDSGEWQKIEAYRDIKGQKRRGRSPSMSTTPFGLLMALSKITGDGDNAGNTLKSNIAIRAKRMAEEDALGEKSIYPRVKEAYERFKEFNIPFDKKGHPVVIMPWDRGKYTSKWFNRKEYEAHKAKLKERESKIPQKALKERIDRAMGSIEQNETMEDWLRALHMVTNNNLRGLPSIIQLPVSDKPNRSKKLTEDITPDALREGKGLAQMVANAQFAQTNIVRDDSLRPAGKRRMIEILDRFQQDPSSFADREKELRIINDAIRKNPDKFQIPYFTETMSREDLARDIQDAVDMGDVETAKWLIRGVLTRMRDTYHPQKIGEKYQSAMIPAYEYSIALGGKDDEMSAGGTDKPEKEEPVKDAKYFVWNARMRRRQHKRQDPGDLSKYARRYKRGRSILGVYEPRYSDEPDENGKEVIFDESSWDDVATQNGAPPPSNDPSEVKSEEPPSQPTDGELWQKRTKMARRQLGKMMKPIRDSLKEVNITSKERKELEAKLSEYEADLSTLNMAQRLGKNSDRWWANNLSKLRRTIDRYATLSANMKAPEVISGEDEAIDRYEAFADVWPKKEETESAKKGEGDDAENPQSPTGGQEVISELQTNTPEVQIPDSKGDIDAVGGQGQVTTTDVQTDAASQSTGGNGQQTFNQDDNVPIVDTNATNEQGVQTEVPTVTDETENKRNDVAQDTGDNKDNDLNKSQSPLQKSFKDMLDERYYCEGPIRGSVPMKELYRRAIIGEGRDHVAMYGPRHAVTRTGGMSRRVLKE